MRADHLTAAEIQAYATRRIRPERALEVSDHLLACAECRALIRQTERFHTHSGESARVSYEELADFVDDKLDPLQRQEVTRKLAQSAQARAELENLLQFTREVAEQSASSPARDQRRRAWILPLAAAIVAGLALLWWNLSAPQRSNALMLTDNGVHFQIAPDGSLLSGSDLPLELRTSLQMAFTRNRLDVPAVLASLAVRASNLAGTPTAQSTLQVISPVAGVIEQATPHFHWSAFDGAARYRVIVVRDGSDDIVATGVVENGATEWTPPTPLTRGETYTWQVQALAGGSVIATAPTPPQPEAKFRVLDAADVQSLQNLRQRFGSSHLALALAYARAGLIEQADAEITALARENPHSAIPERLQGALRNAIASARD